MKTDLHYNDTVRFPGRPEIWRVVNTINGSKADIQRVNDYNPHIITVTRNSLQVVWQCASPNSSF